MELFYDQETVIWRGLADQERRTPEEEIIAKFSSLSEHMLSNNVLGKLTARTSEEKLLRHIVEDFQQYNSDLINDGLVAMARDHSETGPNYGISYGFSTSKNRTVAKAFAMGAMVIADYGQQRSFQHLLKSRIVVGAYKAHKDVDLTRLKQLRPDFSYKYGRQQEVMGIGAADPDSIMFVQTLNEQGEVITSYVRNPERPYLIYVYRGEVSAWPTRKNPKEIIDLR